MKAKRHVMSTTSKLLIILAVVLLFGLLFAILTRDRYVVPDIESPKVWDFRSVDTMKYSRDVAASKLNDLSYDSEIETEVSSIAATGATHVAIATPYDDEFVPFLKRWVEAARRHHLKVWFRGNWSNWEGWFGRERKMTFEDHTRKTVEFIKKHPELFENGDAFTGCPECENGAQGDPRMTRKIEEYRAFLINEHEQSQLAFKQINKTVNTSLLSMNKDVADLIMDQATAKGVGGYVTIDHYVGDAKKLAVDVNQLAEKTQAKIVLGEFGAPIPDLNGEMTEDEQAAWIDEALSELRKNSKLYGLSYWVNKGGSTAIWNDNNTPKKAVAVLTKYFLPMQIYGSIIDELGFKVKGVIVEANNKHYQEIDGQYLIPVYGFQKIKFVKEGYEEKIINITEAPNGRVNITMKKQNPNGFYSFWVSLRRKFFPS